ncbi:hypothetical protein BaRGS_00019264, partial [Batillaria attramentaria]
KRDAEDAKRKSFAASGCVFVIIRAVLGSSGNVANHYRAFKLFYAETASLQGDISVHGPMAFCSNRTVTAQPQVHMTAVIVTASLSQTRSKEEEIETKE